MGEVGLEGKTLVITRIATTYHLSGTTEGQRPTIERVLGFHADYCPIARSIKDSIEVTTALEYVD